MTRTGETQPIGQAEQKRADKVAKTLPDTGNPGHLAVIRGPVSVLSGSRHCASLRPGFLLRDRVRAQQARKGSPLRKREVEGATFPIKLRIAA